MTVSVLQRVLTFLLVLFALPAGAEAPLRILTWDGYVTSNDIEAVNGILDRAGYAMDVQVIAPYAENAEQMFNLLRNNKADISFLTLFFIKMQGEKSIRVIQPINVESPRLSNYKYLLPSLTKIPMGMRGKEVLYIPFAGGSYGFYVNRNKVPKNEIPTTWRDLFLPRWHGKYSLNQSQVWYNVAIASMAVNKPPYYLNSLAISGERDKVVEETRDDGPLAIKLKELYQNAGGFWTSGPAFSDDLAIVSSWGMEVQAANKAGGNWQRIHFKEGDLVWMDTINFVSTLVGRRLEAAELVANYFIGKEVQSRVAEELSLVSVSTLSETNPILTENPNFFQEGTLVPPYDKVADNFMTKMSDHALKMVAKNHR